ncbi:phage tail sheath family protein [Deminuibacter soli]|uniref:Phage tail sheath family protein n=1 Tax=Deminuibacter soli TaxID=2291815 RepID=A0A3E1NG53_9BACT|nr:phage tail sheath C-terminal domain-containing protein [Deminuibacter soli]RFM26929.1 phage tail sheath family protein [Deminuibacter soli]
MPVQPTYPGVYIEELSSGVRTITGVATSITAFVGRALRGPVSDPVTITSYGDFQRIFGGIWTKSTMSYAVRDFYQNGGSVAIIVRIEKNAVAATGTISGLALEAASKGTFGNNLQVWVDHHTKDEDATTPDANLFNLFVSENAEGGTTEAFLNVSVNTADPRFVTKVLAQSSNLVRIHGAAPGTRPDASAVNAGVVTKTNFSGGTDGDDLDTAAYNDAAHAADKTGLFALNKADLFNLLCITPAVKGGDTDKAIYATALSICVDKRAILLVDTPLAWGTAAPATVASNLSSLGLTGPAARNAAIYYPRVLQADPQQDGLQDTFVPCGLVAGIISQTDSTRGIWKSPAGIDAALSGVQGLQTNLSDLENGLINPVGINCLRNFPLSGVVVWGARTMRGADKLADEYKYLAVRRVALYIEESLYRGTQWVVFEPNDEPLWAQIRLNVGAFMHNMFRQGAFQGTTPKQAYLVKCDKETTTQNDIDQGIVNILVGFAPLKPAEFVYIKIQQLAGQIDI